MFTELIDSLDFSYLIPSKEEVDKLIKKLENNEELTIEDWLVLSKANVILNIKERGIKNGK